MKYDKLENLQLSRIIEFQHIGAERQTPLYLEKVQSQNFAYLCVYATTTVSAVFSFLHRNSIIANILTADLPSNPEGWGQSGSKYFPRRLPLLPTTPSPPSLWWGQKVNIQPFQNKVMLHIKLKGITNAAT